jgi:hypothetical protein
MERPGEWTDRGVGKVSVNHDSEVTRGWHFQHGVPTLATRMGLSFYLSQDEAFPVSRPSCIGETACASEHLRVRLSLTSP